MTTESFIDFDTRADFKKARGFYVMLDEKSNHSGSVNRDSNAKDAKKEDAKSAKNLLLCAALCALCV
jgi:hypothetical protein